jgi:hypothetical protein
MLRSYFDLHQRAAEICVVRRWSVIFTPGHRAFRALRLFVMKRGAVPC